MKTRFIQLGRMTVAAAILIAGISVQADDARPDKKKSKGKSNSGKVFSTRGLPSQEALTGALKRVVRAGENGGFGLNMWATIVDRDGVVRNVTFSGENRGDQWPGSRVISAQKANTANAFSLPGLALSTANIFTATQPGGSLYGLQHSNPVDTKNAYKGPSKNYGKHNDPLVGEKVGGVNVFGGGLGLYNRAGELVGAIGVSGDTSCADHVIAWKVRAILNLDNVPAGVAGDGAHDNIIFDPESGWGHASCGDAAEAAAALLPETHPVGPEPLRRERPDGPRRR